MNWNEHSGLESEHAFLSGSSYHWINYTPEKLEAVYRNLKAKEEGIELHEFASVAIRKKMKLSNSKKTINLFVNDCINLGMKSEQLLFYSPNAFGTADAISFSNRLLRIFDYKSGTTKVSFNQLDVYAAYFCLEYMVNPEDITIEERIYQNNEVVTNFPTAVRIREIMETTIYFDGIIENIKSQYT